MPSSASSAQPAAGRAALRTRLARAVRSLLGSPTGVLGGVLVVAVVFASLAAEALAPHDATAINLRMRHIPPAWFPDGNILYPLGTDQLGRDILSRIIEGSRVSLVVGLLGTVAAVVLGVPLGLLSGYFGGWVDSIISRVLDTFLAIPFLVLALAVLGVVGPRGGSGMLILIIVLGLTGWITFTRVVRAEVLSIKRREYVEAATALGQSVALVVIRHVLPNVAASIIVLSTLQVATFILAESALSFLGLGVQPPTVTWGLMLSEGRDYLATSWWLSTFPGIAITLTVLGIILVGDWLRDVLDPRQIT
jgi:peptide/nickel transport system permease protein